MKPRPSWRIKRDMTQSKEDFLFHLFNDYGCDFDLMVGTRTREGDTYFSKWVKYSELMQLNPTDKVPGAIYKAGGRWYPYTKQKFIEKAGHRTILDIELLADVDDKGSCLTVELNARRMFNILKRWGMYPVMSTTGNRGFHLSCIVPEMRYKTPYRRVQMKKDWLSRLGAEIGKSSERSPIALEGELHWKSRKMKRVVME